VPISWGIPHSNPRVWSCFFRVKPPGWLTERRCFDVATARENAPGAMDHQRVGNQHQKYECWIINLKYIGMYCARIYIYIYIYILCRLWCIKYVSNNFRETLKDGWWCLKKTHKLGAESFQSLVESVSRCASVNQEMQGSMIPNPRRPQVDWNYIYQKMASFLFAKGFFFLKLGLPQTIQWLLYQKHSNTTNFWRIFWSWGPPWLKVLT